MVASSRSVVVAQEADVFERSQQVMVSGEPVVVQYDTTSSDDIVWRLGLGCNGLVRVFIERLPQESQLNPVTFLFECYRRQQMGVLATVFRVEGELYPEAGTHLRLQQDGNIISRIKNSTLAAPILSCPLFRYSRSQK